MNLLPQEATVRNSEGLRSNSEECEGNVIFHDLETIDEARDEEQDIRSRYERRRIKEGECWKSLQDELVKSHIENSVMLTDQICVKCVEDGQSKSDAPAAEIRCLDCDL